MRQHSSSSSQQVRGLSSVALDHRLRHRAPRTGRTVCVLVEGTPNVYSDVDITGLTVSPSAISSAGPSSEPTPTTSAATTPTDAPAPAWTADLMGQLQCDGPPSTIGGETREVGGETGSPVSPEEAVVVFAATTFFTSMPARGYERTELEPHWARFEHRVDGRIKAIVILTDSGPGQDPGMLDRRRAARLRSGGILAGRRSYRGSGDDLALL